MESFSSWLFPQLLMLQISLLLGVQNVKHPSSPCTFNSTVGQSVQLQLNSSLDPNIREIEWKWDSKIQQLLVTWKPDVKPDWYSFSDKYKHKFNLTKTAFLNISNLTMEMSGLYTAKIKFHSGISREEAFMLCVYEPIPHPQILIHSSSKASGWCNVSLECATPEATENVTVTWLSNGLLEELEQRGILGPTSNSWKLNLSLPLSQVNIHLTCVASNPADQKNATFDLGTTCAWRGSPWSKWLWRGGILVTVLIPILAAGVCIWKRRKRATERGGPALLPVVRGSAVAAQVLPTEDYAHLQACGIDCQDPPYTDVSFLRHQQSNTEKGSCNARIPEQTLAIHTIYEKVNSNTEKGSCHARIPEQTLAVHNIYEKIQESPETMG
ncbi:SLAM family member 9-like isoform X2 [Dasypus novemcinctus]|uniref:SLAM family member 9-like isoform X2 n=1 Tax=Dasypus novemcinctus TaxID=9361 RepID=UPI00265EBA3F|nr:SLAM family member 9-like isoform X2 [Dasypus novemcinctus]